MWKTTLDIDILFAVDHIRRDNRVISAITDVYRKTFPEDESHYDDLDVKHPPRIHTFADILFRNSINGFFTSEEDKTEVEVCLFYAQATFLITLIDERDADDLLYFRNSLRRLKFYPSHKFVEKTQTKMFERVFHSDFTLFYKEHRNNIRNFIKEQQGYGKDVIKLREEYYFLRDNLKI